MKSIITSLVFFLGHSCILFSQLLSPSTISFYGSSKINGNIMLEDNIGSLVTQSIITPTFLYTQGFIQPDIGTTNIIPHINDILLIGGNYALNSQGTTLENIAYNVKMEYTVGEVASRSLYSAQGILTQGILQPYGKHWIGLVGTNWLETGNWTPSFIPTIYDDVIISSNCPNYPIITNGISAICKNLSLMYGSNIVVRIGGSLTTNN